MPAANLVCPHCESPVELQVTAVTRSRPCPSCGKPIMLQFTQKQGKVKRKALLVDAKGGLDFEAIKQEVPIETPQPLPGDAFERMKADPELIAIKKRLAWSIGVVTSLIVVAAIVHWNHEKWFPPKKKTELGAVANYYEESPSMLPKDTLIARAERPQKMPDKLDFTPAEEKKPPAQARTTTAKPSLPPTPTIGLQTAARNPIPGALVPPLEASKAAEKAATQSRSQNVTGGIPRSLFRVPFKKQAPAAGQHDLAKAKSALAAFLKAPSLTQRLLLVADREVVEPRMRSYYSLEGDGPFAFARIEDSAVAGGGAISEHEIVIGPGLLRRAWVIKTGDNSYLVDWPSFVGEGEMGWKELMASKVADPVLLRVAAEPGEFYAGDFNDQKWLLCVKLHHPARPEAPPIFGYVERQSVLGREIDYWLRLGEGDAMPLTVRVKYPAIATAADQVWLAELVAPSWVIRGGERMAGSGISQMVPR